MYAADEDALKRRLNSPISSAQSHVVKHIDIQMMHANEKKKKRDGSFILNVKPVHKGVNTCKYTIGSQMMSPRHVGPER